MPFIPSARAPFCAAMLAAAGCAAALLPATRARAQCNSINADLIVAELGTQQMNFNAGGGTEAFLWSVMRCNIGNAPVATVNTTNQHPVTTQNLYRLKTVSGAQRFEQVGTSWCYHDFSSASNSFCCTCTNSSTTQIAAGCSLFVAPTFLGNPMYVGPRWEVTPSSGMWIWPTANHPAPGGNAGKLQVLISDLEVSGPVPAAQYFAEAITLSLEEAQNGTPQNNAGYAPVPVTGSGTAWTFGAGTATQRSAAIFAWKVADPGVTLASVDMPLDGRIYVASRATQLPSGKWHYEYAVQNLNSTRSVGSLTIPIQAAALVENTGFHDIIYFGTGGQIDGSPYATTDWPVTRTGTAVSWATLPSGANPNANALRWGSLYNFRFDSDRPPTSGTVTLGMFLSGIGGNPTLGAVVPSTCGVAPRCQPADIANDAGGPLPPLGPCEGATNSGVNEGDYNYFFNTFFINLAVGSPADISDDAGNPLPPFGPGGTSNSGVNEGDYNCFFNNFFNGCPT
ncbi:hypothetical protein BH11PLA1_BH11PLA1_08220 [soil metagenome]